MHHFWLAVQGIKKVLRRLLSQILGSAPSWQHTSLLPAQHP